MDVLRVVLIILISVAMIAMITTVLASSTTFQNVRDAALSVASAGGGMTESFQSAAVVFDTTLLGYALSVPLLVAFMYFGAVAIVRLTKLLNG